MDAEEVPRVEASPTAHRANATHVVPHCTSASVHLEPNKQSRLAARLPAGTPIRGAPPAAIDDYADWMELEQPVRGWIRCSDVQACDDGACISDKAACTASLFAAMQASRDDAVGSRPMKARTTCGTFARCAAGATRAACWVSRRCRCRSTP